MLSIPRKLSPVSRPIRKSSNGSEDAALNKEALLYEPRSNRLERFMLLVLIIALPLENHFPAIGGKSIAFYLFLALGLYVLTIKSGRFVEALKHPICASYFFFLIFVSIIESFHDFASFSYITSMFLMIMGTVVIASLTIDYKAIKVVIFAYIIKGLWISVYFISISYNILAISSASSFSEGSAVRSEIGAAEVIRMNLNNMGFMLAQSAIIAITYGLTYTSVPKKYINWILASIFTVACFSTMSRGAIMNLLITATFLILTYNVIKIKSILPKFFTIVILLVTLYYVVPSSVYSRLDFSVVFEDQGTRDARGKVYQSALYNFKEYAMWGIGCGNFLHIWGATHGFVSHAGTTLVAHSTILQTWINWGILGLLFYIIVWLNVIAVYKRLKMDDVASTAIRAIIVSLSIFTVVSQGIYSKHYSVAWGLLIAYDLIQKRHETTVKKLKQHRENNRVADVKNSVTAL